MINVIFMFSDQHRWDWLGCRGASFVHTPNLDRLAVRGVRFDNALCNAPLCGPSRMSMLTGRHPFRNEVWINEHPLASDVPTFAHALAVADYDTVLAGRMHFMHADQRHGFQQRLTGDICRCYWGGPDMDLGRHAGSASGIAKALAPENLGPGHTTVLDYDEAVTWDAVDFLHERASQGNAVDKPLCMVVGWYAPHHPFIAPEQDLRWVADRLPEDFDPIQSELDSVHPWLSQKLEKALHGQLSAEQIRLARINYAAMINVLDRNAGRILDAAEQLPGDTIVVYSSDHGESAGDHGFWGKCSFWESSVNVPMIWANLNEPTHAETPRIAAGATVAAPVSLLDMAPTLVELGGAAPLPLNDGASLLPVLRDPCGDQAVKMGARDIFVELELWKDPPIRMIRRGRYKLSYFHQSDDPILFDVEIDPLEQRNLAVDPQYKALCDELVAALLADWNPEEIHQRQLQRMDDMLYLAEWGHKVGMGRLDTWCKAVDAGEGAEGIN